MALRWPVPDVQSADAFYKIGLRRATACSVISAAVLLTQDGTGRCRQARIALGAVAPRPIRAYEAEESLCDQPLDSDSIEQAGRLASQVSSPIDDVRASAEYRKRMADVLVRRLLNTIVNGNAE
jgi:carbon-monoxide dehydrogenase medium subunit